MKPKTIRVSDVFYGINDRGNPCAYVYVSRCNLNCNKVFGMWDCDTVDRWTKGTQVNIIDIATKIDSITPSNKKNISVIIGGGEPLIQQKALKELISILKDRYFIEVETNGTLIPDNELFGYVDLFTVSPKLPSSGNSYMTYYNPKAIEFFAKKKKAIFRFTLARELDIDDMINVYGSSIDGIAKERVYLSPITTDDKKLQQDVIALCMQYGYNHSIRLQNNLYEDRKPNFYPKARQRTY